MVWTVKRGREDNELCLKLKRDGDEIRANGSYFVGVDWVKEQELAVQVSPKMNDGMEIDYVRMLNEALCESENFDHLKDLVTIKFDKPSVIIQQNNDSKYLHSHRISQCAPAYCEEGTEEGLHCNREEHAQQGKGTYSCGKEYHTQLNQR